MSEALPEVVVPEWPADPVLYATALNALPWFDLAALSTEDRRRGRMYAEERARRAELSAAGSLDDWLASLQQRAIFRPPSAGDLARATQLMNKTNQLNLSTRRLSEAELMAWAAGPRRRLWTVRVEDRFGDSGLTGLVSVELAGAEARIVDFVLSCRVMGRHVEQAMIFAAARYARECGAGRLLARHLPTERNGPTLMVLRQSGLAERGDGAFVWDCRNEYPLPQGLAIIGLNQTEPHSAA